MCGIIGFMGKGDAGNFSAVDNVVAGLKALEYRGYDSAGVCWIDGSALKVVKAVGHVDMLANKVAGAGAGATIAIGHTRWATHGGVTESNCHPHLSSDGRVAVVHNGIISNFVELRNELKKGGAKFSSDTDTEVIPNLIAKHLREGTGEKLTGALSQGAHGSISAVSLFDAVKAACKELVGSYAFLAVRAGGDEIVAAKHGRQPLAVGTGATRGENGGFVYLTSDLPTAADRCKTLYTIEENEFAVIRRGGVKFYFGDKEIDKVPLKFRTKTEKVDKGAFSTYMEKEIFEIPSVIGRINTEYAETVKTDEWAEMNTKIKNAGTVHIAACGTSYHAGLRIAHEIERNLKKRTKIHYASELIHNLPYIDERDIAIVISQSGETADTLSALLYFKSQNLYTIGICNVEGSSIARYVDMYLPTHAGREVAVASTKAYIAQILVGMVIVSPSFDKLLGEMARVCQDILDTAPEIKEKAKQYANVKQMFILGKGVETVTALECALKIKEITYKHCEGFPAGELKHGTLALVDKDTLSIGIGDNVQNALHEVEARGSAVWQVPAVKGGMAVLYGMLFALFLCQELKYDPDKPRNLAKSVTVE